MKTRRTTGAFAAIALASGLIGLIASPSYAADSGIAELGAGASRSDVAISADGYADTPEVAKLKSLVGTQTPAEIEQIQRQGALGKNVQVLYAEDGTITAAYVAASPKVSVRAVSPVGPGCTKTSACVRTKQGVPYGFTGKGVLSTKIPNAISGYAGYDGLSTNFWSGNTAYVARPGVTVNLPSFTMTKINRF